MGLFDKIYKLLGYNGAISQSKNGTPPNQPDKETTLDDCLKDLRTSCIVGLVNVEASFKVEGNRLHSHTMEPTQVIAYIRDYKQDNENPPSTYKIRGAERGLQVHDYIFEIGKNENEVGGNQGKFHIYFRVNPNPRRKNGTKTPLKGVEAEKQPDAARNLKEPDKHGSGTKRIVHPITEAPKQQELKPPK